MAKREFDIPNVTPGEPMDDEAFSAVIKGAYSDAAAYTDDDLAPDRRAATAYYRGDPFGNEEHGRSQVVLSEVRDTVLAVMPSLMRVFCGSSRYAEFVPNRADGILQADQATDYINHIIQVDNPGFEIFQAWFKDALVRKIGIVKFWKDSTAKVYERELEGFRQEELAPFMEDDSEVEIIEQEETDETDPETGEPLYKIRVRHYADETRFRVRPVPPEEFIFSRDAVDLDSSPYVAHRQTLPVADLVAMGYDYDEILENCGTDDGFEMNEERETRNLFVNNRINDASEGDPMMKKVLYVEHYIRADRDGDGIAEMRRVCTVGGSCYILHEELWDEMVPFSTLCPDPEPHMLVGMSLADQVGDLQKIKSNILRYTLDSLANSIDPDLVVLENQVNMADVMNTERGKVIRTRAIGAVQELRTTFIGPQALEVIGYLDRVKGQRTGITETTQGLDPDALQSTTKAAVTAATQAAQQRIELICRTFAETGVKRLMKGLLRLAIRYQDKERVIRLRGQFVPVDPQYWDAEMDVEIDVGIGTQNAQERIGLLTMALQLQQTIIQQMGPHNPLCGLIELRNTVGKILQLGGFKDDSRYFKPYGPTEDIAQQQNEQAQQQAQKGGQDPASLLAGIEQAKVQAQRQTDMEKNQLKMLEMQQKDDLERDRMAQEFTLEQAKISQQAVSKQQEMAMRAEMDRQRNMAQMMQPQPAPGGPPNGP